MSNTVNTAFVQQFKDNLIMLTQIKGSKILSHVPVEHIVGKYANFERLGSTEAEEVLTRHGLTPDPANIPHSRRRCILRTFDKAEMVDDADKVRMLIDPTSPYALTLAYALGRKQDDIALMAMYGDAAAVDSADAQTSVAFAAANIIDDAFGGAQSNLTVEKLREARRILLVNNVDLDAEVPIILHEANALMSLLAETEVTSADFNSVKALVNGQLNTFMGFKFVAVQRLADAAHKTAEGFTRALVLVPSAVQVAVGRDIITRISEESTRRYSTQVYAAMDVGAVRLEEEKIVSIECAQV